MSYMDEYNKLKKKRLEEEKKKTSTKATNSGESSYMDEYNKLKGQRTNQNTLESYIRQPTLLSKKGKVEEKKTEKETESKKEESNKPWYKSGVFEDGYQFGDVTKHILGVDDKKTRGRFTGIIEDKDDAEQILANMSSNEIRELRDATESGEERRYYTDLINQKQVAETEEKLSAVKLENGTTLLEELHAVAGMEDGNEKKARKKELEAQMLKANVNPDEWYSMLTGDKNITWTTAKKFAKNAAYKGLNSFNTSLTGFLDLTVGGILNGFGWEDNPISKLDDYYENLYDSYSYDLELAKAEMGAGGWADGMGNLTESTVAALPQALMAFATMGSSATPSLSTTAAQASGTILQNAGLTVQKMLKNPQYWLSFVSTYEDNYEDAKKNGADDLTAGFSATITSMTNAGVEVGGGIDVLPDRLAGKGNKAITEWVKSSLEEGGEEVVQGIISNAVARGLYDSDREIINPGEMIQEFGMGAAVGGILGGGQIGVTSALNTGANVAEKYQAKQLTKNEEAVVNKVYEDTIAEKEKNGKLTAREKNKIYDDVVKQMERGYIDTDTIESVLGGESYEGYKSLTEQETSIKDEIEALENTPESQFTVKQRERLTELREQLKGIDTKTAKSNLFSEVDKLTANDTKLRESYNERMRAGEDFKADFNKYKGTKHEDAAKKTLENAVKAGANNTNRVHDLVDMMANLSSKTGKVVDFKSNEDIKNDFIALQTKNIAKFESIENRTAEQNEHLEKLRDQLAKVQSGELVVDGNIAGDSIVLNLDSPKPLNRVTGHEVTHSLEKAKSYENLRDVIFAYAKSKGVDTDAKIAELKLKYEGVKDANPEAELVADLVGDYLFTDVDFINNLSTEHRNLAQRIYDEIKHLLKLATAGSKEARELERVKHAFENAFREAEKNGFDSTKHSLSNGLDNEQNLTYNGIRGESYARTDEFRNLQAESQRMSDEDTKLYHSGSKQIDDEVRGRLSRTFGLELRSADSKRIPSVRTLLNPKTNNKVNIVEGVDGSLFHDVFEISRNYLRNGELVDLHTVETTEDGIGYNDCYNYLSEDGLSGFSITPDGDLISVFNLNTERGFLKTIAPIVKEKAKTLDCYASPNQNLMVMYEKIFGFKTASLMDYNMEYDHDNIAENHSMPRVAFMVNTDSDVELREFTEDQYDEALEYRNSFVNQAATNEAASFVPENDIAPTKYSLSDSKYLDDANRDNTDDFLNDDNYLRAVNMGRTDVAKEMVLTAAYDSGLRLAAFHGSDNFGFTKFNRDKSYHGGAFYFTNNMNVAESYSSVRGKTPISSGAKVGNYTVALDIKNPLKIDCNNGYWDDIKFDAIKKGSGENGNVLTYDVVKWAEKHGYDGVIFENIIDPGTYLSKTEDKSIVTTKEGKEKWSSTVYAVFESNQIKSLDAVTYDDNGNVIPLSKRFNKAESDIRYSLSDSNGNELSKGQQEYFKNSKAVDNLGNLVRVYHGTRNADFTVFKRNATYFTDNKEMADSYSPNGDMYEGYVNITKPYEIDANGEKWSKIPVDDATRKFLQEYGSSVFKEGGKWRSTPADIVSAIEEAVDNGDMDYDGIIIKNVDDTGSYYKNGKDANLATDYIVFDSNQFKNADNMNPTDNPDINLGLSERGEDIAPAGNYDFYGKDFRKKDADVAPVGEAKVEDYAPGENLEEQLAKADESIENLDAETEALFRDYSDQKISDAEFEAKWKDLDKRFTQARQEQERLSAEMTDINNRKYESLDDSDIPPEVEAPYYGEAESIAPVDPFAERNMNEVGNRKVKAYMYENPEVKPYFQDAARGMLYDLHNGTKGERIFNEQMHYESGYEKGWMGTSRRTTGDIADLLDQWGYTYDQIEAGLNAIIEDNGKENNAASKRIEFMLDNRLRNGYKDVDGRPIPADEGYINLLKEKQIDDYRKESFDSFMEVADQYAPPVEDIAPVKAEPVIEGEQTALEGVEQTEEKPERLTRAKVHSQIVAGLRSGLAERGFDLDEVLSNAHRMNNLAINDNTPQRVNDKTFGYEAGEVLNDLTFNKVALNESDGTKWLNEQIDTIRNLSKKYKIKPLSKESSAAQMYAEGFWVNENDEIIAYGDAELAQDFPDVQVQNRIKALAKDPTIRKIYDDTLSAINASRSRNAYPEIPRLDNYYLHFRAMDDTFSKLGIPFNPNDIKAKDLPTDINGTTIDRKPGQPFFASSMHREGKRTSFDMLGGLEKYLNSAKNQIYHIDDIQTARALWGYIADRYGQAHGLENLDYMEYEAQAEHIQKVYDGHLSNYARFLTEYANNLAGKTALIDRGVEGLIGRRALQFINTVNTQTSRNQVGYSVFSPLTNFIPSMETIARTPKQDSIKAFAQTVANVFRKDGFVENDPTLIRRKGTDKFAKTLWEKMSDPGYILMGAVDNVTSEFIVRTKYNELTRKGMDSKQAHIKAGEWAMRVMGDRSIGQMPLLYNSKFMGLFTKYQLEVRNQLDSAFYDTFQEVKASTKDIENQKAKNAVTAAKIASKTLQIAVLNHAFGMAFEKIAGYNPAFDIVSTIATLFGWDDDEEDEDTFGDNANQAFKELLGDLPYANLITDGGRIPAGSAMPIKQLVSGVDKYGNEKPRWETVLEALPYYILPGGYGQIKKSAAGLGMFSDEHPVSGSYTSVDAFEDGYQFGDVTKTVLGTSTDGGNLRFPVEKTFGNVLQAGLFGQYASENARDYFDNERSPLKEKQIQEYIDVDIPIRDYWDYREGLAKLKTNEDKVDYIDSLDLPLSKKNILVNNVLDRKEDVDLANYSDYGSLAEFDFAVKYPEKYQFFEEIGITYDEYKNSDDDAKDAYNWAYENPDKYTVAMAVSGDVVEYRAYTKGLSDIKADKDENGKSVNGSRKEKVFSYIDNLPLDYGQKCILFKSQYKSDDSMNMDIIEYLDSREDISYEQMVTILTELDFTVNGNNVYWD